MDWVWALLPPIALTMSLIVLGCSIWVSRLTERRYQEEKAERERMKGQEV